MHWEMFSTSGGGGGGYREYIGDTLSTSRDFQNIRGLS